MQQSSGLGSTVAWGLLISVQPLWYIPQYPQHWVPDRIEWILGGFGDLLHLDCPMQNPSTERVGNQRQSLVLACASLESEVAVMHHPSRSLVYNVNTKCHVCWPNIIRKSNTAIENVHKYPFIDDFTQKSDCFSRMPPTKIRGSAHAPNKNWNRPPVFPTCQKKTKESISTSYPNQKIKQSYILHHFPWKKWWVSPSSPGPLDVPLDSQRQSTGSVTCSARPTRLRQKSTAKSPGREEKAVDSQ